MSKTGSLLKKKRNDIIFYAVMIALPVLQFIIFYLAVNVNSILLAFKSYFYEDGGKYEIVWFDNIFKVIRSFFTDSVMIISLKNSFIAFFISTVIGCTLAVFFSYYIYKKFPLSNFFKVMLFLPSIVSAVAMVILFQYLADNGFRELFGGQGLLENSATTFGTILFFNIWIGFGTSILLYVGAMSNISESVIESAQLEGVGFFKEFYYIVFPHVYPTFVTFIMMSFANLFANQLNLMSFYGDNVQYRLYTVGFYMYYNTYRGDVADWPMLSALGVVVTLIIAPLTFFIKWLLEKIGPSDER